MQGLCGSVIFSWIGHIMKKLCSPKSFSPSVGSSGSLQNSSINFEILYISSQNYLLWDFPKKKLFIVQIFHSKRTQSFRAPFKKSFPPSTFMNTKFWDLALFFCSFSSIKDKIMTFMFTVWIKILYKMESTKKKNVFCSISNPLLLQGCLKVLDTSIAPKKIWTCTLHHIDCNGKERQLCIM